VGPPAQKIKKIKKRKKLNCFGVLSILKNRKNYTGFRLKKRLSGTGFIEFYLQPSRVASHLSMED
tara:strand:- start:1698 stop:1892 length:195 start_codon:yes stop_codon:yes gene_type:complete